jgi:deferrochelatase/peroxidase EfeB/cytochrome P450
MNNAANPKSQNDCRTAEHIQANLLRAPKFGAGKTARTRDWSLFFFFRILSQWEFDASTNRLVALATGAENTADWSMVKLDLTHPSLINASLPTGLAACRAFRDWLKIVASGDAMDFLEGLKSLIQKIELSGGSEANAGGRDADSVIEFMRQVFSDTNITAVQVRQILEQSLGHLLSPTKYREMLASFGPNPVAAGAAALAKGLPGVMFYEALREGAPAFLGKKARAVIRGEAFAADEARPYDTTPVNLAFTYSGLQTLGLDKTTLASFPAVFSQGMAARAERLQDTGPSAPDYWEGELGLSSVHGMFTGGFDVGEPSAPTVEASWSEVRADIRAFNDPHSHRGQFLRFWIGLLLRPHGIEILHIELGQDPYDIVDGQATPIQPRIEHFGFRDGLSQPFLDLGLHDPAPGGGTPAREDTWAPVAPGEIFLDQKDEDGAVQLEPINADLRCAATYLVFRKLEQDVSGFNDFIERQRPVDASAQAALAAQFVGRWTNGTPLVLSPYAPRDVSSPKEEARLNDFLYVADDPLGQKCPLGAHIRRTNPRDIGGRDDARRHRILRRSMSYGGSRLQPGSLGDGEPRGLLFMAVNARIDLQFEVIQADWINEGELLGQVGLARCPLVGSNGGDVSDSFLEAGAGAPVTNLPRFVTMRGGDYFFAPGVGALKLIAQGNAFPPPKDGVPYAGFSLGDPVTPTLFDPDRLGGYAWTILNGGPTVIRVEAPPDPNGAAQTVAFIAKHADVLEVLRDNDSTGLLRFSVLPYHLTGQRITRGSDLIIGTDAHSPNGPTRARLHRILNDAWWTLAESLKAVGTPVDDRLRGIVRARLELALQRVGPAKRLDLVADFATEATYGVLANLFGAPGPNWLTEMAVALRFSRAHIGQLSPDWIAAVTSQQPDNVGLTTVQIWSALILADLIGNVESQSELQALSRQAGSEMLAHIDGLLVAARGNPPAQPLTLVDAFVKNEGKFPRYYRPTEDGTARYYRDVGVILLELMGTSMATIPLTFAKVMGALFQFQIDLPTLLASLGPQLPGQPSGIARVIYEAERLNPDLPIRMRHCEVMTTLASGGVVSQGDWVCALIQAATRDPAAFPSPLQFSIAPYLDPGGPARPIEKYLLFGDINSPRACWGRKRVAISVLEECLTAAGRLEGLRPVAGSGGIPLTMIGVTVGLNARFTRVLRSS